MKFSTTTVLLTAALGVSAHPSGHAHRHAHRSMEARGEFVIAKKPAPPAVPTPAPAPAPAPPAAKAKVEVEAPKSKDTSSGDDDYVPFCEGNTKRATLAEIAYKGNIGVQGNYGCNMMLVKPNVADKYKYLTTFTNRSDKEQECMCWNKIGPDGVGINGFFIGNQALTFKLPGGGKQSVAFDANSQGGCACDPTKIATTAFGQIASTWLEFDFGNDSNGEWSGADASCLVSAALGLNIPGMKVCGHGTCSTIYPGGKGENAYLGGMEALDGIGLNLPAGQVRLDVDIAYKG